ncbi:SdiA-regulated domain-containing protein [Ekhidna sp.]|uniref:SdiA-regulated domain-containing protein n=1 Tax=Ekhidna sp. TaxID=2608089 RepID=UPI003297A1CA
MIFIKNIAPILLFILLIFFNQGCSSSTFGQHADSLFLVNENLNLTYDLKSPTDRHYLPYVLEEVSGLSFKSPAQLLAIDDESGKLFEYDIKEKQIIHSISFAKADDYEGVELVGNDIYVLKHDGDVFHFQYTEAKQTESKKYETALHDNNDTEGLGYDATKNLLLIACKEDGHLGDKKMPGRGFYIFDIETKTLGTEPYFVIGPKELEAFWEAHRAFDYDQERIKFKPSAIATHPLTGNYYILSSVGKMLLVVSKTGSILATYPISPRILGQPEGICFSTDGTMFISSEGEGDRGYILEFEMKKTGA